MANGYGLCNCTKAERTARLPFSSLGDANEWTAFRAVEGLEALRALIARLPAGVGINIEGDIGLTSHIADLVRKAKRPARILRSTREAA